jgi:hypothetical protein
MEYTNVTNPQWADAQHSAINCNVDFVAFGVTPFTANPNDSEIHGVEIFNACVAGEFGPITEYEPPAPPTNEQLALYARYKRNNLLAQSDWTQLPDVPDSLKQVWATYRQALRDVTLQAGFPTDVVWPTQPI